MTDSTWHSCRAKRGIWRICGAKVFLAYSLDAQPRFLLLKKSEFWDSCSSFRRRQESGFLALQHKLRWMPACAGMMDNDVTGKLRVSIIAK
jgi:hypothetical protein